jgi:Family of unknown function (DUF5343)
MAKVAETSTETGKTAPPYIAFSTLKTLVSNLKAHGIPPRIDKSIMSNFSGAVASQLMTALRFLGLINADEAPTPFLKSLVDAFDTPQWSGQLQTILKQAYPEIFKIDLATASPKLLYETFESAYSAGGETVRKTVTFFLNAASDAGIQVSSYITKGKKPRSGKRRNGRPTPRPLMRTRDRQNEESDDEIGFVQTKLERSPYEVLMHDIYDPKTMKSGSEEEKAVFTLARYLKSKEAGL